MNKFSDRGNSHSMVPSTPNLELYKQHNKTKPKKKNPPASAPIQPTLQPHIFPSDRSPKVAYCSTHPDKKADYYFHKNPKKKFCAICAITYGGGDD